MTPRTPESHTSAPQSLGIGSKRNADEGATGGQVEEQAPEGAAEPMEMASTGTEPVAVVGSAVETIEGAAAVATNGEPTVKEALAGGLTAAQVSAKQAAGESNAIDNSTSRSVGQIIRANIFTLFNAILAVAAIVVLVVGEPQDAVFALVLVLNAGIGVVSEIRAKRTLDSLAVLHAPTVKVSRDGKLRDVPIEDLVTDEVVHLQLGDQIPADGQILSAVGLEVDESALTGESLPVVKTFGSPVLSGTNVVAGYGKMLVQTIGEEAWAQKVTREAKRFSLAVSEIQHSLNQVLKWISWILPFVVLGLAWAQMNAEQLTWQMALVLAISGMVGMIPQGLVLLTSMNFGLAAATLARRGVLVQELPAVEILARVDVLCLDKTGTLTTGKIRGRNLIFAPNTGEDEARQELFALTGLKDNETSRGIAHMVEAADHRPGKHHLPGKQIPFNSARKWSAHLAEDGYMWVLGAPEILGEKICDPAKKRWLTEILETESRQGRRVVCLAKGAIPLQLAPFVDPQTEEAPPSRLLTLPPELEPVTVCILEEDVREDAAHTLAYFAEQGVRVKVISGDSPGTVGAIASELGLQGSAGANLKVMDARQLPEVGSPEFADLVRETDVFGRVTPEQKQGIVSVLQQAGHTVAMTGDGVNDALALKTADLGIAMGNGAPATKAVSRLVLTNGRFSVLPGVVAEGRRIIANMERVSGLFLSKTIYALLIALVVGVSGLVYPLLPRHLTFIGWFTIGIPSFFLALAPNSRRYHPGFLRRTLFLAIPAGLILGAGALISYVLVGQATSSGQSAATITIILGGLWLLGLTARPFNWWRVALLIAMILGAGLGLVVPLVREFFALQLPAPQEWMIVLIIGVVEVVLLELSHRLRPSGQ